MIITQRHLPHWIPGENPIFVTWRLAGTLPHRPTEPVSFLEQDQKLDRHPIGPLWLGDERIAKMIVEALLYGEVKSMYRIHAFVVMPNHVHVLWTPVTAHSEIMQWLKGTTARRANRILGRHGTFWQDESFDHWTRNQREFDNVSAYIEFNPVSAGLVEHAEEWVWSSASRDSRQDRLSYVEP
jgi:REP element-mobilizing transposase RayT